MTHTVIIVEDGAGEGGTAKATIEWTPAHGMKPAEETRRRERAERLLRKANAVLYDGYDENDED